MALPLSTFSFVLVLIVLPGCTARVAPGPAASSEKTADAAVGAAAGGAGGAVASDSENGSVAGGSTAQLAGLPATFVGDLPGEGGTTARHQLDLYAEGFYALAVSPLGSGDGGRRDEIGRFTGTALAAPAAGAVGTAATGTIELGGRAEPLRFTVLADGNLAWLAPGGGAATRDPQPTLQRRPTFSPLEPLVVFEGEYRFLADAGRFTECRTGQRFAVARDGDSASLERAYLAARRNVGEELLVRFAGRLVQRGSVGSGPAALTVVVDRFERILPGNGCPDPGPAAASPVARPAPGEEHAMPIEGTPWQLVELDGRAIPRHARGPSFTLVPGERRVAGSGGCNRMSGPYELTGDELRFGALAATRMACAEGMELEQEFFGMLDEVRRAAVEDGELVLFAADGSRLARFAAGD